MLLMYFVKLLMKLVVSCELPVVYIQEGPSLLPTFPQSWKNNIVKIMFIYLCICCKCLCMDTQFVGISSSSTTWTSGIQLRCSALATSASTCPPISLAHEHIHKQGKEGESPASWETLDTLK